MTHTDNVVRGLTASLHNDRVSEEGKERVIDKLDKLGYQVDDELHVAPKTDDGSDTEVSPSKHDDSHSKTSKSSHVQHDRDSSNENEHEHRVLGGYKAVLHREGASEAAKEHARDMLDAAGVEYTEEK